MATMPETVSPSSGCRLTLPAVALAGQEAERVGQDFVPDREPGRDQELIHGVVGGPAGPAQGEERLGPWDRDSLQAQLLGGQIGHGARQPGVRSLTEPAVDAVEDVPATRQAVEECPNLSDVWPRSGG